MLSYLQHAKENLKHLLTSARSLHVNAVMEKNKFATEGQFDAGPETCWAKTEDKETIGSFTPAITEINGQFLLIWPLQWVWTRIFQSFIMF